MLVDGKGTTRNSQIVAMWYDQTGDRPTHLAGTAYAVACPVREIPPDVADWIGQWQKRRGGPDWIYALASNPQRLCVVGVSGPTIDEERSRAYAEEWARSELAQAIELRSHSASAVLDDQEILYAAVTSPCDSCAELAKAGSVVESWQDKKGEGPIPLPGTTYVLMCMNL